MSDIAITPVGFTPKAAANNKPNYLITLEGNSKTNKRFITLDKPDMNNSYVSMKGLFTEATEDHIIGNYNDLLTTASKEDILELTVPWHRINSIRSLVFKAK